MFRSSREGPTEEKAGRRIPIRLGTALIAAARSCSSAHSH